RDDASDQNKHKEEYAVIHTTDRDVQHRQLYLIQYENGRRSRHISQATADQINVSGEGGGSSLVWFMRDLRGFRKTNESTGGIPIYAGLSDGPYWTENLQSKLIGRVVGFASSPLGELLAPAAGWENEEAGNAAFDPAEYIDALLSAGFEPYIFPSVKHGWDYCEHFPERRQTESEKAAVLAARYKYCAASTALDRVIEECKRRRLIVGLVA
ncbi:MAG: hypothetical protein M3Z35_11150, partial [Nitrospirota bacterium]|nr:hypothetical protein [Nitrospirota bacterium]